MDKPISPPIKQDQPFLHAPVIGLNENNEFIFGKVREATNSSDPIYKASQEKFEKLWLEQETREQTNLAERQFKIVERACAAVKQAHNENTGLNELPRMQTHAIVDPSINLAQQHILEKVWDSKAPCLPSLKEDEAQHEESGDSMQV